MNDNSLTVVVFRDRLSARSFQVSLKWISRLGWTVFFTLLVLTLISLLAVRFYFRIQNLEHELSQGARTGKATDVVESSASEKGNQSSEATSASAPDATSPGSSVAADSSILFRDFSSSVRLRESSSIQIEGVSLRYQGSFLNLRFHLRYTLTDGGRQQGHFIILARGPETLMSYPDGTLNLSSDRHLLAPDRGEYFSVGKFREVEASFPAPRKQLTFREIQVLVFNEQGQLIRLQTIPVTPASSSGSAVPRSAPESSATSSAASSSSSLSDVSPSSSSSEVPSETQ